MDPWVRVQCSFDSHPDVMALDHVGRTILQHIWRRAKAEMSEEGILSKKYLSERYLARACGIECPHCVSQIGSQIELLFELGLLSDAGEQFEISNWNKYQKNSSNRDRQRRFREREREKKNQNPSGRNVTVTPPNGNGTLCNALEKRREEKNKNIGPEVGKKESPHSGQDEQLRDERAKEFFFQMQQNEIMVRGRGRVKVADALPNATILANRFSDESVFPGLSPTFIFRAAAWVDSNPRRAKKDIGGFLFNWASREKPGDAPINNKPQEILQ